MEKVPIFNRTIHKAETNIIMDKIIFLIYEKEVPAEIEKLSTLASETKDLIKEFSQDYDRATFNYIDNNCFEIDNLLDDLKNNISSFVDTDVFLFLTNKNNTQLNELYLDLKLIKDQCGSITVAKQMIENSSQAIISTYVYAVHDYLYHAHDLNALKNYQPNIVDNIVVNKNPTLKDWNLIYKQMNLVVKSITIQNELYATLQKEVEAFEKAYLLVMTRCIN